MKFTIRTELDDEQELTSSAQIEQAVNRLATEPGSFLCIEPEHAINEITYIQAAYIQKTKGLFKKRVTDRHYLVEVQEEKPNGDLYQYFHETQKRGELLEIIYIFFESQTVDLETWRRELFYKSQEIQ